MKAAMLENRSCLPKNLRPDRQFSMPDTATTSKTIKSWWNSTLLNSLRGQNR